MTRPWYETAFAADYIERYAHRDREEAALAVRTLVQRTGLSPGARVFDLCCGAGRHAIELHGAGLDVTALDLSHDLLTAARESFRREHGCFSPGHDSSRCPSLTRGDMRALPFASGTFDVVTHFFTAFGYFESDEENFGVFWEVARVLRPHGWYLFDFFSAPFVRRNVGTEILTEPDGTVITIERSIRGTPPRIEKTITSKSPEQKDRSRESVRLYKPEELTTALAACAFDVVEQWGDYSGVPYRAEASERFIVLGRLR